jgi:hypothetical protein
MNDPEMQPQTREDLTPEVSPEPTSLEEALTPPEHDPFTQGTKLIDAGGAVYQVDSSNPDHVVLKSVVSSEEEAAGVTPVTVAQPRSFLSDHLRGKKSIGQEPDWLFAEPEPEQVLWTYPVLNQFLADHEDKRGEILNHVGTITNRSNNDIESIKAAGKALELPGVTLVDVLQRSGFPEEVWQKVADEYGAGPEDSEKDKEISPEERELADNVKEAMKEINGDFKSILDDPSKFNSLDHDGQTKFNGQIARLRAMLNDFKETKTYGRLKFSLKTLFLLFAAVALLQLMMISAHAGSLGKK